MKFAQLMEYNMRNIFFWKIMHRRTKILKEKNFSCYIILIDQISLWLSLLRELLGSMYIEIVY